MITAAISVGSVALVFGILLGIASIVFKVEVDPRVEKILELLPGANCGGCGQPGCAGFAVALANDPSLINACPVLNAEDQADIAQILGVAVTDRDKQVALIRCSVPPRNEALSFEYRGPQDCASAMLLAGGPRNCKYGCLGLGSCVKVCPFGAMKMSAEGLPLIDNEKCTGCGKCVAACPKSIIDLVPQSKKVHVLCKSLDKGKDVKSVCKSGCIGCGICARNCPCDAITMENNYPVFDYTKCTECGVCVAKCPVKIIDYRGGYQPKIAEIDQENCIKCTKCYKVCKFNAIEGGKVKEPHQIIEAKCTGCGACVPVCPKKCIELKLKLSE